MSAIEEVDLKEVQRQLAKVVDPEIGMPVVEMNLIDKLEAGIPTPSFRDGSRVVLLGPNGPGTTSLAGSRWAVERRGHAGGALAPPLPRIHQPCCVWLVL